MGKTESCITADNVSQSYSFEAHLEVRLTQVLPFESAVLCLGICPKDITRRGITEQLQGWKLQEVDMEETDGNLKEQLGQFKPTATIHVQRRFQRRGEHC